MDQTSPALSADHYEVRPKVCGDILKLLPRRAPADDQLDVNAHALRTRTCHGISDLCEQPRCRVIIGCQRPRCVLEYVNARDTRTRSGSEQDRVIERSVRCLAEVRTDHYPPREIRCP